MLVGPVDNTVNSGIFRPAVGAAGFVGDFMTIFIECNSHASHTRQGFSSLECSSIAVAE